MNDLQVKRHPYLNIWVREDGCVYLPQSGTNPAHWTFGTKARDGYLQVKVAGKRYPVHRLAVETFIGPIPEGCEIDHVNRNRADNRVGIDGNLRIVTPSENRRNCADHDCVEMQGRTHTYEDRKQYGRDYQSLYRAKNKDKIRDYQSLYRAKNKDKIREWPSRNPDKVREQNARYYGKNKEKVREQNARYHQSKRQTHRQVRFSDGSLHWLPLEEAVLLMAIPLKQRFIKEP